MYDEEDELNNCKILLSISWIIVTCEMLCFNLYCNKTNINMSKETNKNTNKMQIHQIQAPLSIVSNIYIYQDVSIGDYSFVLYLHC